MKFPNKLCVKIERENDTKYFVAQTDMVGLVEVGETVTLGLYRLIETATVKGTAEVTNRQKPKS